ERHLLLFRLNELQHEPIGLAATLKYHPRAIVGRMVQRAGGRRELKSRLLHLRDDERLVDSMQRLDVAGSRARLRFMIDDAVNAAGLERLEYRLVHRFAR